MTEQPTLVAGHWLPIRDGDPRARALYLRHYSCGRYVVRSSATGNKARFCGPGEHMALLTVDSLALWVWRAERFRRDGQVGINCAIFRNEGSARSSTLIREACALAWLKWPGERLFTFVDPSRVASRHPGYCYLMDGWRFVRDAAGRRVRTKSGKLAMEVMP